MVKYNLIDHTADFGIHVFGSDLQELFENSAYAVYDVMTDVSLLKGNETHKIQVIGDDWPDLMINWLREVLFLWAGMELLVKQVEILSISEYELTARINADPFDSEIHSVKKEIKAVTYHQLRVFEGSKGWEAEIIFDV